MVARRQVGRPWQRTDRDLVLKLDVVAGAAGVRAHTELWEEEETQKFSCKTFK